MRRVLRTQRAAPLWVASLIFLLPLLALPWAWRDSQGAGWNPVGLRESQVTALVARAGGGLVLQYAITSQ